MKEKLSALIDAELSEVEERRVFETLRSDPELRGKWERYHLIRAAVTRQLDAMAPQGLAERISAVLEGHDDRAGGRLKFGPLVAGFAVAASVAAVAIVTLTSVQPPASPSGVPAVAASSVTTPGSVGAVTMSPAITTPTDSNERLNPYLVGHNEFMPTAGIGGMLPYARLVAHDREK